MSYPGGLDLLVIQPTALCNLDCRYCYVPDRQNSARLPLPILERLLIAVRSSRLASEQRKLKILWHAGEPLAAGIEFYRQAFALTAHLLGERYAVRHAMQSNGTLINDAWCRLFAEWNVRVGVSLDGPEAIHDANRKRLGGGGSFRHAMRGIELLRSHGFRVDVLSVLTTENIDRPEEMFQFFLRHELRRVAFNVEEIEGPNLQSSLLSGGGGFASARARYGAFMRTFHALNREQGQPLAVRELRSLAGLILAWRSDPARVPDGPERRLGGILTVARDGAISSWSPELASAAGMMLGNICDVASIDELLESDRARTIQAEIDRGIAMCRTECEYFGVCGGGSPGNKFYEHGTLAATETLKCALHTKELVEVIAHRP
ncbi:MAG TPA: cyclophane-forming radical SAM/SPASM peptide maturase GrrM/OscB [Gemmatimonadales bacterium]|nr:cyclophane-forming radical SAM/SPASM peptide maturase GrrM/OscB [Gemmatimonadales bacterium]